MWFIKLQCIFDYPDIDYPDEGIFFDFFILCEKFQFLWFNDKCQQSAFITCYSLHYSSDVIFERKLTAYRFRVSVPAMAFYTIHWNLLEIATSLLRMAVESEPKLRFRKFFFQMPLRMSTLHHFITFSDQIDIYKVIIRGKFFILW